MKCVEKFTEIYGREPEDISFCPYRVCPVGAHSDHMYGKVTGFAIDKGIHIAYGKKQNGVVELMSLQFDKRAQFHIESVPQQKENDWADHLRGAVFMLSKKYTLSVGLCGVIEGSLPIGGLSSSAAVIIAFLKALCTLNNIKLSQHELVLTAQAAENKYVGVACGKLDQSCEIYSKKDHLLYLDTKDDTFELIPVNPKMKPFKIAIFFSGLERSLAGSKFNMRVDECRSAAYSLKAYAGMEYGKFEETFLRDVPRDVFEEHKEKLPESFRNRAIHWYNEFDRVEKAVEAFRCGDIEEWGRLSFESGKSSIEFWETGSLELKKLYEIMCETEGIYGGRFSGAGFKGCCMAIVNPDFLESIEKHVTEEYLKAFPELTGKFSVHFCDSTDGVSL